MKIRSKIVPLLLAGVVAVGLAVVPAVAAEAATAATTVQANAKTGSLSVQLVGVTGKTLKKRILVGFADQKGAKSEGNATTNSKGLVTFKKVTAGTRYIVAAGFDGRYLPRVTTKVTVKAGKTTRVSLKLVVGASISGIVRDADGEPVADVPVAAVRGDGSAVELAYTTAKGAYKIEALNSRSYKVVFNYGEAGNLAYSTSYWKNAADLKSAKAIKATQQTTKKSATAAKLVNGTVAKLPVQTVSGSVDIPGAAFVNLVSAARGSERIPVLDGAFTAAVPVGNYTLSADVDTEGSPLPTTYWYVGDNIPASQSKKDAAILKLSADSPITVTFSSTIAAGR